jgi:hypothetical protein
MQEINMDAYSRTNHETVPRQGRKELSEQVVDI